MMLNDHPFFRRLCLALQEPLRWDFFGTKTEPCPMSFYAFAYGFFGLVLGVLALLLQGAVCSRIAGAAVAAVLVSLLRGYVSGWRQSGVPFQLALLLAAKTSDSRLQDLRAQCLANSFVLLRPFLYFCMFAAGTPFWLAAALSLTCPGANDLVETMEPRKARSCPPEWVTAAVLTVFAALLNCGSWRSNLATGLFVSVIAWLMPLFLCKWALFAQSRKMTEFVFENILLLLFAVAQLF